MVHYFVKICFLLLNILYLFGFCRKMTPPLTMVISWLMEYSLRYDLPQLKSELKDLFPNLVVLDKLEIPDKKTLVDLATLRLIINRCLIKLVNRIREHLYITSSIHENSKLKPGKNMLCTKFFSDIHNNFCTQYVLPMFCKKGELLTKIYLYHVHYDILAEA